jgi:hypothetical protein
MAWLPPIEKAEAITGRLRDRIVYLDKFAARAPALFEAPGEGRERPPDSTVDDFYVGDRKFPPPPAATLASVSALMTAGELALVTNQTERAKDYFRRALGTATRQSADRWPILRVAVLGAALRQCVVFLQPEGLDVRLRNGPARLAGWVGMPSFQSSALILGAALASAGQASFIGWSSRRDRSSIPLGALSTVIGAREADVLPLFRLVRTPDGFDQLQEPTNEQRTDALIAFYALHQRYASRLYLVLETDPPASDPRDRETKLRHPLFDWALFMLHLGLARFSPDLYVRERLLPNPSFDTAATRLMDFVMSLVREFQVGLPSL